MQKFKTLDDAIELARYAHRHQTDKAGLPYFDHPYRVMQTVQAQGAPPYVQQAAILHDVTEDTAFSSDILLSLGFSEATVKIVRLVDRDYSKTLFDKTVGQTLPGDYAADQDSYYYYHIQMNPGAAQVKLADIADNTLPWRLSHLTDKTQERLIAKYDKARKIINGELF